MVSVLVPYCRPMPDDFPGGRRGTRASGRLPEQAGNTDLRLRAGLRARHRRALYRRRASAKIWGQQVIVANHPGANGSIAARFASQAIPDGYTLFMPALSTFASLPSVAPNLPLRLPRDFVPIGFTIENPMFIAVNPTLGINTLPELIARAKKEPGTISIAVTGVGRLTHLTGLLLQQRADIQLVPVPYNGGPAAAMADVGTNRVSMIIEGYSGIMGGVNAGQLKIIAVASRERLPEFPDVPTVAETLPGFFATGWQAMVAPVGTPAPIVDKVSADLFKVMSDPDLRKRLGQVGNYTQPMNSRTDAGLRQSAAGDLAADPGKDIREIICFRFARNVLTMEVLTC